ncbi:cytochrome P450 2G1-like [Echinops telfairi]|uniref:Cytochrome P450 2G1-like n=1 Tax=Echinops telfairi TaxID=9371 RepID=A0ABM0IXZ5_ECHTE|nr:cytochrome P450 2G1-like [Echinops telfairi]
MELVGIFTVFQTLCLSGLLVLIAFTWNKKRGQLPPGPTPLPFLGNLLQVSITETYQSFKKLKEKYGPVFTVYMGLRPVVVLCDADAVKEAFVGQADNFSGREEMPSFKKSIKGHGVSMANGERWRILRRFSLAVLQDFGMGKRSIEERIQEEAGYLMETLRKTNGAPTNITFFIRGTVSNVICSILFGSRFDYKDKQFLRLLELTREIFIEISTPWTQLFDMYYDIMQYFPGRHNRNYYMIEEIKDFMASRVKLKESCLDPSHPQDFIDCFLIKKQQDENNPNTEFNHKNLIAIIFDLFFAGTETVSFTLLYGILLLLKYPEVEARVHEEINQVIGTHRTPSVKDRVKMPYTNAVIHEIQRIIIFSSLGVPHKVIRETHFRGFLLPKGTKVLPLYSMAHRDPKNFRFPDTFYPQHFLDEQGGFKKNEALVPFGAGKRACLGEALAQMELFLYFTSILQSFSLRALVPPADIDITPEVFRHDKNPTTYEVCLVAR